VTLVGGFDASGQEVKAKAAGIEREARIACNTQCREEGVLHRPGHYYAVEVCLLVRKQGYEGKRNGPKEADEDKGGRAVQGVL